MSDRGDLVALLERFGIKPDVYAAHVVLQAKVGGVRGYTGFSCEFEFDGQGKFVEVVVWE